MIQHFGNDDGLPEPDFNGPVHFGPPMIVEAIHALRESGVARMTLLVRGNHDKRRVLTCEVRPATGIRCTDRWRKQARKNRTVAMEAVYAEMRELFVSPEQVHEDFDAKFTFIVDTGIVRVSDLRFLKPHFAFADWQRCVTLR
jgi:hypothetical protein